MAFLGFSHYFSAHATQQMKFVVIHHRISSTSSPKIVHFLVCTSLLAFILNFFGVIPYLHGFETEAKGTKTYSSLGHTV